MKFTYLIIFFALILGVSMATLYHGYSRSKISGKEIETVTSKKDYFPPVPVLKILASDYPGVTAESVIIIDADSGVSLYEKNADEKLLPASTTKIITALVAMDYYRNDEVITVGKINVAGQKMGLVEGEKITVEDLLNGLLIYSANDAAEVLAESYPGGKNSFVSAMNDKSSLLHLENSNFTNPSGLDGLGLTTTARDLARESVVAMKIPFFRQVVGTKEKLVTSVDGTYKHKLTNINELIGEVPGVLGIKTGWTENAKENLVSYVERDGHSVVLVVLKSADRFGETKNLINWVFNNFEWKKVEI